MALTKKDLQAIESIVESKIVSAIAPLKTDIIEIKNDQKKMHNAIIKLEDYVSNKGKASLNGVVSNTDINAAQDERLTELESTTASHELRIKALESYKKKMSDGHNKKRLTSGM